MSTITAEQTTVIIVGAGPSGLGTAACLHKLSIPYIILEREDCIASTFSIKSYDRLHLNFAKQYCQLPHLPFPDNYPTFVPRLDFLKYLDEYASRFNINPVFGNFVTSAKYDEHLKIWKVETNRLGDPNSVGCYEGRYLVVATGENGDAFIPDIDGLSEFKGEVIHSTQYKCGKGYVGKSVLVVGSGNSGMEIALDLSNYGAKTSIVVRSPMNVVPRWLLDYGVKLLKFFPMHIVDSFMMFVSKVVLGDLTKYGIQRPKDGPFILSKKEHMFPVVDVGTCKRINSGHIQVLPALKSIRNGGNEFVFENQKCYQFDTIVFATGYKRSTHLWLQGENCLLNEDGQPTQSYPKHWKGDNGIYCAGLATMGLVGAAEDAQKVATDISNELKLKS